MKKLNYSCRWFNIGLVKTADITIIASNDSAAIKSADESEAELNIRNCTRNIYQGNRLVYEPKS